MASKSETLDEKIARIRLKNAEIEKRHDEVQRDKQKYRDKQQTSKQTRNEPRIPVHQRLGNRVNQSNQSSSAQKRLERTSFWICPTCKFDQNRKDRDECCKKCGKSLLNRGKENEEFAKKSQSAKMSPKRHVAQQQQQKHVAETPSSSSEWQQQQSSPQWQQHQRQSSDWQQQQQQPTSEWQQPQQQPVLVTDWAEEVEQQYQQQPAYWQQQQVQQSYYDYGYQYPVMSGSGYEATTAMTQMGHAPIMTSQVQQQQQYQQHQHEYQQQYAYVPPQQQQQHQHRNTSWFDRGSRGGGGRIRGNYVPPDREVSRIPSRFQKQKQPAKPKVNPEDEFSIPSDWPKATQSSKPSSSKRLVVFAPAALNDRLVGALHAQLTSVPIRGVNIETVRELYSKVQEVDPTLDAHVVIHVGAVEAARIAARNETDVEKGADSDRVADAIVDLALDLLSRIPYLDVFVSTLTPRFDGQASKAGMSEPNCVRRCMNVQLMTRLASTKVKTLQNDSVLEWFKDEAKRDRLIASDGISLTDSAFNDLVKLWTERLGVVVPDHVEDDSICDANDENSIEESKSEDDSNESKAEDDSKSVEESSSKAEADSEASKAENDSKPVEESSAKSTKENSPVPPLPDSDTETSSIAEKENLESMEKDLKKDT